MNKNRLEAFSDGVLAIIITIMVLGLQMPNELNSETLWSLFPVFESYVLSFLYIGIYWNNHHHLIHTVTHVNGKILWANLNLLFWLSLIPFCTLAVGKFNFDSISMFLYGINLCCCGISYAILQHQIIVKHGKNHLLYKAVQKDVKGKLSVIGYIIGIAFSFYYPWISGFIYLAIALLWIIPDKRIEKIINENNK
ncbi:TMEM175 family protein [Flavobacterium sp. j3]|uniref:TMEM175 family protein n=1 Tax=Flavobacterium aureirubrum TaxID=3133147 RepID=A0ABU9N436_9FLAO